MSGIMSHIQSHDCANGTKPSVFEDQLCSSALPVDSSPVAGRKGGLQLNGRLSCQTITDNLLSITFNRATRLIG